MRRLCLVLAIAWLVRGQALAAAASQGVEGRLAIDLAQALAERGYGDRAKAILRDLPRTYPERAAQAEGFAAQLARRVDSRPGAGGPVEYREALEEARRTGQPVMLFFGREACGLCRMTKASLADASLAAPRRYLIEVQMNCDSTDHSPLMWRLAEGKGMRMLPFIFYVSADEELLDYSSGGQSADDLRGKLDSVLRKAGKPMDPERLAAATEALEKANALMDSGKCGAALTTYRALARIEEKCGVVKEAADCIEIIDGLASRLLAEAREAAQQEKYADAAARLLLLQRDLDGTEAAEAAGALLEKLKADPQAEAELDALAAQARSDPASDTPAVAEPDKPTPGTADANARRAEQMLRMARNYIANNLPARAKPILQRLLKQYPDTDAAIEARELLRDVE